MPENNQKPNILFITTDEQPSFFGPHYPLDVPEKYFEMYRPEDMPVPRGLEDFERIQQWQENRAMYMGLLALVESVDLTKTILKIAGLEEGRRGEALPGLPGRSSWDYIRRGESAPPSRGTVLSITFSDRWLW